MHFSRSLLTIGCHLKCFRKLFFYASILSTFYLNSIIYQIYCVYASEHPQAELEDYVALLKRGEPLAFEMLANGGFESVPILIDLVQSEDPNLRIIGIAILGEMNEVATDAIPFLVDVLGEAESHEMLTIVVRTLRVMGDAAVPTLATALSDEDFQLRYRAAWIIAENCFVSRDYARVHISEENSLSLSSSAELENLEYCSEAREAVHVLVSALQDEDFLETHQAITALEKIGPVAQEAVPHLINKLERLSVDFNGSQYEFNSLQLVQAIQFALIGIGEPSISNLIAALEDGSSYVRSSAASALGEIGPEALEAVPFLIKALEDERGDVRSSAASALGEIGPEALEAVPFLIKALEDEQEDVRSSSVSALSGIGSESKEILPELFLALRDENSILRSGVSLVMLEMGPNAQEAVPFLITALQDRSVDVRSSAALALGGIGPEAREAVPLLITALQDRSVDVRSSTALALGGIGPEAREAVPLLITALQDGSEDVRSSAALALGGIGPEAREAIPLLITALQDGSRDVRSSAASALGGIGPEAQEAAQVLIADLLNGNLQEKTEAAVLLGEIGPEAREAVPYLVNYINNSNRFSLRTYQFRYSLVSALGKIGVDDGIATQELIDISSAIDECISIREIAFESLEKTGRIPQDVLFNHEQSIRLGGLDCVPRGGTPIDILTASSDLNETNPLFICRFSSIRNILTPWKCPVPISEK